MIIHGVPFPIETLADICRRYGAERSSVYGSILRDDFGEHSDVDMLVEFSPQAKIGLIGMANGGGPERRHWPERGLANTTRSLPLFPR